MWSAFAEGEGMFARVNEKRQRAGMRRDSMMNYERLKTYVFVSFVKRLIEIGERYLLL